MQDIENKAKSILHSFLGEDKDFRTGQLEAVKAILENKRTLVVQRTGWGKSMVYFICTKLLRESGKGATLIISPLLALMSNQIEAAAEYGLKCEVLNSTKTSDEKEEILGKISNDSIDIVFTTPETLFSEIVSKRLSKTHIGLFVIDEAHCISDWGHDFRLDYCRLNKFIKNMPAGVPLLATTATANDRVIADLTRQLGGEVFISRGELMRDNLAIQVLKLANKTERYGWMLENIPKLQGSGIVYCLTRDDCDEIAYFLAENGISARAYYSGKKDENDDRDDDNDEYNIETESLFMDNKIKVIVATVKLGMGYDKGDISFVIHFQTPPSIVAYYQQIGRAGRNITKAYTFLMNGKEDADILEYFRETAFPKEEISRSVYDYIRENANNTGVGINQIAEKLNFAYTKISNALKFLVNEEFVYKEGSKYFPSVNEFHYNSEHYRKITEQRIRDYEQMLEMLNTDLCYNRFIVNALDDPTSEKCGICANCLGYEEFPSKVSDQYLKKSEQYLQRQHFDIIPRKRWAATSFGDKKGKIQKPNQIGICLSRYGQPVFGELVKQGKYRDHRFCDKLVEKSAELLSEFVEEKGITALTFVPSLRSNIVEDFAERLAVKLNLPCLTLIRKTDSLQQKDMENSSFQCENALRSFSAIENLTSPQNILLLDDMVDSKWTLTVCGCILSEMGAENVYPYVLASTSKKDE